MNSHALFIQLRLISLECSNYIVRIILKGLSKYLLLAVGASDAKRHLTRDVRARSRDAWRWVFLEGARFVLVPTAAPPLYVIRGILHSLHRTSPSPKLKNKWYY